MCTLRSPQGLSKNINDYGDLKDGQSIVLIHRHAAFLQMERKEFFHFRHMMVPYYIQKTAKDNQTDILSEYLDILDGYFGFQSQISQVRVNLSKCVSIP